MASVVILGGYGRVGRLCAREIAERTPARLQIAGPNIQKAESAALALGGQASAAYGNASDPRALSRLLEGSRLLVVCSPGLATGALELAIGLRVAVVAVSTLVLDRERSASLAEQAWRAGVPLIVHAGAVPGLPGVLAELLVRRFASLAELRIASTGPWRGTRAAARDVARCGAARPTLVPPRFRFGEAVGTLAVQPAFSADLQGFAEAHLVERLIYLEPWSALDRIRRRPPGPFCLVAEARVADKGSAPDARIEISAADPLRPAAVLVGSLAAALLGGEIPPGLHRPREARSPALLLSDLEKRGVDVRL